MEGVGGGGDGGGSGWWGGGGGRGVSGRVGGEGEGGRWRGRGVGRGGGAGREGGDRGWHTVETRVTGMAVLWGHLSTGLRCFLR